MKTWVKVSDNWFIPWYTESLGDSIPSVIKWVFDSFVGIMWRIILITAILLVGLGILTLFLKIMQLIF